MQNNWAKEVRRVLWSFVVFTALGLAVGRVWLFVAIAGTGYAIWNLWQLKRIHSWLVKTDEADPPESIGFWGDICDKIYYLQKQQKTIQAKLEADVAYLRGSFASLSDAVVMVDHDGSIDWCNGAAMRLLGLHFPKDHGQHIQYLFRDPEFVGFFESQSYEDGIEVRAPNNPDKMLKVQVSSFGTGNRLIFARDVTEIYALEQMRRDFVSNVSHELRTPLTVITGYIDNLHMVIDQLPALEKPLAQMQQQALRMERLLKDLIDLSRLETLPSEMHKTRISLTTMSSMVVDEAKANCEAKKLQRNITLDIPHNDDFFLLGQETEVHSALLNLVVNACKYSLDDGNIEVSCWHNDDGVWFSVKDDGVGIDPIQIPRLTERFYRVDQSRSTDSGGTGLGLAIVKRILIRHEAELLIESAYGKGSTFTCHFPSHRLVVG
ncbi:Phosphate regulon sensor protein PhoR [BD1-7 clade bacterium]|uniref:Phosphate regulon sensor protein PhoR n=1 Tax=BD1-7 clade bacterium TaxID=2029982 RepID=A0A5S9NLY5_9GAMM|nr:Phosphate regulon sensor protein PhoR [BD1-7 clade bacterium]